MKDKIKIWQFITGFLILLLILRFSIILNISKLFYFFINILLTDFHSVASQITFEFIDYCTSAIIIVLFPVLVYFLRKKVAFLRMNLSFISVSVVTLILLFILAPVITGSNPEFGRDLIVTKLLPPFSKVKVIHLNKKDSLANYKNEFFILKNYVIKKSFDESIVYADSIQQNKQLVYFQGNRKKEIDPSVIVHAGGKFLITEKVFLLGTDELGRDIFSRLIYGVRISLFVGLGAVSISLVLGLILGFMAGFSGGLIDLVLSRFTDMLLAFPMIFLVVLILALFGNSLVAVIIVLGFSGWMSLFKIVRGEVISIKNKEYFISAKMIGLSNFNLLYKEVLPVIAASVVVNLVFLYGNVILAEAALSFLGLGTGSSYPSWGQMIEAGQNYLASGWWMILFPGMALFFTLFTANKIGKEINKYFNPTLDLKV